MKILCITPAYYPAVEWGGPIVSVHLLNKELVRLGHEVIVYTTTFGLDKKETQEGSVDGVKVFYFRSFKVGHWLVPFSLAKKIWQKTTDFDIAHISEVWNPASWLAGLVLALQGKKYIISPRGAIDLTVIKKHSYFLKLFLYHILVKYIFKKAAGFHFTSEYERDKFFEFTKIGATKYELLTNIRKRKATKYEFFTNIQKTNATNGAQKSTVIFNPLDLTEFKKTVDKNILAKWNLQDKKYFLYLGRLSWKKGLEILIEAFAQFRGITRNLTQNNAEGYYLVVAGPDEAGYQKKIEKMVAEKNLTDKIIFTGLVQGDYKLALLQNAQAFILPSYSENFGIVVAEAMATGVPVIISSGVGLKDVIEKYNAGLVFDINNNTAQNLLEKIQALVSNHSLHATLVENGRKLVQEQFNPSAVSKQMVEFYNEVR